MTRLGADWKGSWRDFATRWKEGWRRVWLGCGLYLLVTWLVFGWFDEPLLRWIQSREMGLGQERWLAFAKWLQDASDFFWFNTLGALALIVAGLVRKRESLRVAGISFFLAALMAGAAVQVVKALTGRARPSTLEKMELAESAYHFDGLRIDGAWRAYPSGHSAAVWASCMVLGFRFRKTMAPMLLLGLVVAWSRMYGNFHWPTDVLHGSALGAVFGWFWGSRIQKTDKLTPRDTPSPRPANGC